MAGRLSRRRLKMRAPRRLTASALVGALAVLATVAPSAGAEPGGATRWMSAKSGPTEAKAALGVAEPIAEEGLELATAGGTLGLFPWSGALSGQFLSPQGGALPTLAGGRREGGWPLLGPTGTDRSLASADGPSMGLGRGPAGGAASPGGSEDCDPHPPILISEDEGPLGFVLGRDPLTGTPVYRPGSGVVAGEGTAEDPYLIEGWCIQGSGLGEDDPDSHVGFKVEGTRAHVLIRGNTIEHGSQFRDVQNATVAANQIIRANTPGDRFVGVYFSRSQGNTVRDNTMTGLLGGIQLNESDGNTVRDNTVRGSMYSAIYLWRSTGNLVDDNTLTDNLRGVHLHTADGNSVRGNTITNGHWIGVVTWGSDENIVQGNTLTNNRWGIVVQRSDGNTVQENTMTENQANPLEFTYGSRGNIVRDNTIHTRQRGICLCGSRDTVVSGNTMQGPGAGISLFAFSVDVEDFLHEIDDSNTVNGEPVVYLAHAEDVTISDPVGQLILVDATNVAVEGFESHTPASGGIQVAHSTDVRVANSTLMSKRFAIGVEQSTGVMIRDNALINNQFHLHFWWSEGEINGNAIRGNHPDYGIGGGISIQDGLIGGAPTPLHDHEGGRNVVRGNLIADQLDHGLNFFAANEATIHDNTITGNGSAGIRVWAPRREHAIYQNNIHGNARGIAFWFWDQAEPHAVDARFNWWGCPSGPEHAECNDVVADLGSGEGDVAYTPWLTEPSPDAPDAGPE